MSCDEMYLLEKIRIHKMFISTNIGEKKDDKILGFYDGNFVDIDINPLSSKEFNILIAMPVEKEKINNISKCFCENKPVFINVFSEIGVKNGGIFIDEKIKNMRYNFSVDKSRNHDNYMRFIAEELPI